MPNRLDNLPVYRSKKGLIEGHYYNHVLLALSRIESEIRLAIPGLIHLDLILDKDAWVIVDRVHADYPVAAWSDFETAQRQSLDDPIPCLIRIYHAAASLVLQRTLDAMETIIEQQLLEQNTGTSNKIIPFSGKKTP